MSELYIHKSVHITSQGVTVDGKPIGLKPLTSEVNGLLKEVYQHLGLNYSKFFKMDALSKLGFISAELLLGNDETGLADYERAVVLCNRSSSLNTDVKFQETLGDIASPAVFVYTLPNIVIGEICIKNNIKGECAFFVQDAWDIPYTVNYVSMLFNASSTKQCVTGWVEVDVDGQFEAKVLLVGKAPSSRVFLEDTINELYK